MPVLPRGFGWLKKLVRELQMSAGQLCGLLQSPEMRALFAEAPQIGRVLRPLVHILGLPLTSPGNKDLLPGPQPPRRKCFRNPNPTRQPRPARAKPQPPDRPWERLHYDGPPWRTRADAMGIPRKIRY